MSDEPREADDEVRAIFSALSDRGRSRIGEVVDGRYEIVGELGRGGMGVVYRAHQAAVSRDVALKLLHPAKTGEREAATRFEREMQAIAQLEHPHIVRLYDVGTTSVGERYMAMELVEGRTLAQIIEREGRLPPGRAAHVGRQVARALSHAHGRGIVHRDLTPRNILLRDLEGAPDTVTVLDFGLVALLGSHGASSDEDPLTREGAMLGTPRYFAPEQARGGKVGHAADLYSLGVVLYEALAGAPPFSAPNPVRLAYLHVHEPPQPPSERVAGIPPWLEQVVMRLLAKYPAARPPDARAVAKLLEGPATPRRSRRHARRRLALAAVGAVLLGGGALVASLAGGGQQGPPPASPLRAPPEPAPIQPDSRGLRLSRMAIARGVREGQPVDAARVFDDRVGDVLCHLTIDNREGDARELTAVWYQGARERARVPLEVRRSKAWLAWAGITLRPGQDVGQWRCEVENESGVVLGRLGFEIRAAR